MVFLNLAAAPADATVLRNPALRDWDPRTGARGGGACAGGTGGEGGTTDEGRPERFGSASIACARCLRREAVTLPPLPSVCSSGPDVWPSAGSPTAAMVPPVARQQAWLPGECAGSNSVPMGPNVRSAVAPTKAHPEAKLGSARRAPGAGGWQLGPDGTPPRSDAKREPLGVGRCGSLALRERRTAKPLGQAKPASGTATSLCAHQMLQLVPARSQTSSAPRVDGSRRVWPVCEPALCARGCLVTQGGSPPRPPSGLCARRHQESHGCVESVPQEQTAGAPWAPRSLPRQQGSASTCVCAAGNILPRFPKTLRVWVNLAAIAQPAQCRMAQDMGSLAQQLYLASSLFKCGAITGGELRLVKREARQRGLGQRREAKLLPPPGCAALRPDPIRSVCAARLELGWLCAPCVAWSGAAGVARPADTARVAGPRGDVPTASPAVAACLALRAPTPSRIPSAIASSQTLSCAVMLRCRSTC